MLAITKETRNVVAHSRKEFDEHVEAAKRDKISTYIEIGPGYQHWMNGNPVWPGQVILVTANHLGDVVYSRW